MTPNQSHDAGLELALDKLPLTGGDYWQLKALIAQAKAAPAEPTDAVELLRAKFPRIDPCQPAPLDEKAHCCEYTIYVERERLHRFIDDQHKRLMAAKDGDVVKVPESFVRFLLGEAEIDGCGFGELHPSRVGMFWWREQLRALLANNGELQQPEQETRTESKP